MCNDKRLLALVDERQRQEAERGIRAWLLAPDIATYQALMRGESVPVERLNRDAVLRYGIRQRGAA